MSKVNNANATPDLRCRRLDEKPNRPKQPSITPPPPVSHSNGAPPRNAAEGSDSALELVVVVVKVALALVVVESSATDVGLSEQPIFAVEEETLQERLTVPLNPPVAVTVIVEVPDCPGETFTVVGLAETE